MKIPVNAFMWIIAFLPIVVLLLLMIKFRWGATNAALAGLILTIITGIFIYKGSIQTILIEVKKGIWNALPIILIIWTAILLYQVAREANGLIVIRNGMRKLLPNELLLLLAMGWAFESFLQGITGFGVPVAVGAPLLIGLGVTPLWAVIIPLLGQTWGNTFGTLGAAWDSLAMTTGMTTGSSQYLQTALWAGIFLWLWNFFGGIVICWYYGKAKAIKKGFLAVCVISLTQGGGELLLGQFNTTISCFLPSCISLVAIIFLGKLKMYRQEWKIQDSPIMNRALVNEVKESNKPMMNLKEACMPYVLLSALALVILLIKPINALLGTFAIGLSIPKTVTGYGYVTEAVANFSPLRPFTHASMFLLISSILSLLYYRKHNYIERNGVKRAFKESASMTVSSALAIVGLIIMSNIMSGTGQTIVLANGISRILGKGYIILAPIIGMLGSFMTGSNLSSNILFGNFQLTTGKLLGVSIPQILALQTTGGCVGGIISSSKIILGTTTAGIVGREGEALKKIIPITIPPMLVLGAAVFLAHIL